MPQTTLTLLIHEATEHLRTALHEPTHTLTAPELCEILSAAKPFYWMVPDLFDRLANQMAARIEVGNLRDDRGPDVDPAGTAGEAIAALQTAAAAVRSSGRAWEDAHSALAHLADYGGTGS